jgi:thiamine biosynthesis protein ThiI
MPSSLLLLSGGIDSPVAGHMMLRKGCEVEAVHFTYEPASDDATERKCIALCEILGVRRLYVIPAGLIFGNISKSCAQGYYFVLSKRAMYRMAHRIASGRFDCLTTGESLGQVSSQTLRNLSTIDSSVPIPVVRPLLWMDKVEITQMAREIGTYETSLGPELCDMFGPEHPDTRVRLDDLLVEERKIDYGMINEHMDSSVRVRDVSPRHR